MTGTENFLGLKKFLFRFWKRDSARKVSWIEKFLIEGDRILDIGSGPCFVTEILRRKGYHTTPVDITKLSVVDGIEPVIFDGRKIPFKNEEFDVALLLTVLHHVRESSSLLKEAGRVSKRLIVIEDTYSNRFQELFVKALDSIMNLEFLSHPHNNGSDPEWRDLFNDIGFDIIGVHHHRFGILFSQTTYNLTKIL